MLAPGNLQPLPFEASDEDGWVALGSPNAGVPNQGSLLALTPVEPDTVLVANGPGQPRAVSSRPAQREQVNLRTNR